MAVSTVRTVSLPAEFVAFLKRLLKLYLHINQETVDYFVGTDLAQNFQQYNKQNWIVLI